MATFRDWLVFTRTHTAALTIPCVLLGAHLANPHQSPWHLVGFAVLAWLAHASGFGINNLFDLAWDRVDPSKQHHPLVAGRIQERHAWLAVLLGSTAVLTLGALLSLQHPVGILVLALFAVAGTLYNHQCKRSLVAPLYYCISFTSITLYAWFASGGPVNLTMAYLGAYCAVYVWGQIAVLGYLKELGQPGEVNLLRRLGASATHVNPELSGHPDTYDYVIPRRVFWFAVASRAALWCLPIPFINWVKHPITELSALVTIGCGSFAWSFPLFAGRRRRSDLLRWMGLAEIAAYWLLLISLGPRLDTPWLLSLTLLPLAWYLVVNKLFWGTAGTPAV